MANRTVDKNKNPLARSSALPEEEMAVADDDQAQDELLLESGDDVASQRDLALAAEPSGDDEDLRIASGAISASTTQQVARGRRAPAWVMANPITRYIAESYFELLKVTWPEPRYAWNMTWIVISVSVAVAIVLGAADFGLNHLVTWLITTSAAGGGAAPTPTPALPIQP